MSAYPPSVALDATVTTIVSVSDVMVRSVPDVHAVPFIVTVMTLLVHVGVYVAPLQLALTVNVPDWPGHTS